jgi:hypothetical protein
MENIILNTPKSKDFTVNGSGILRITEDADFICGGQTGFSIGVEWSKHKFCGGVLSRDEAKRLAEHILNTLK